MSNRFALGTFSQADAKPFAGVVVEQRVLPLSAFPGLTNGDSILSLLEHWDANFAALQTAVASFEEAVALPLAELNAHPPVSLPRQVFCSGANYKKHVIDLIIDEGGGPMTENWIAAKGSPTYLPFGPYLVPAAFVPDPQNLQLTLKLNGEIKQDESTIDELMSSNRSFHV